MINLYNLICTDPLVSLTCGPGVVLHQLGPSLKSGKRMKFLGNRGVKRSLTSYRLWENYGMRKATKRRCCFSARLTGFRRWQEAYVTWTGAEKWKQDKKMSTDCLGWHSRYYIDQWTYFFYIHNLDTMKCLIPHFK